jgi:hypothetical protein
MIRSGSRVGKSDYL